MSQKIFKRLTFHPGYSICEGLKFCGIKMSNYPTEGRHAHRYMVVETASNRKEGWNDRAGRINRGSEEGEEWKIRGWGREINATTFNFWFRLEGRIFAESEMFKKGWRKKEGWERQTSRWMQEAIFHCPSYAVKRLQLPSHPLCSSMCKSDRFRTIYPSLTEQNTEIPAITTLQHSLFFHFICSPSSACLRVSRFISLESARYWIDIDVFDS